MAAARLLAVVCAALSAMSVGMGALYPNFKEDNPSKIVSGFGGTLNLVLSVLFVTVVVSFMAIPYHVGQMDVTGSGALRKLMLAGSLLAVAAGVVAVVAPLWFGVRAFQKLEA